MGRIDIEVTAQQTGILLVGDLARRDRRQVIDQYRIAAGSQHADHRPRRQAKVLVLAHDPVLRNIGHQPVGVAIDVVLDIEYEVRIDVDDSLGQRTAGQRIELTKTIIVALRHC